MDTLLGGGEANLLERDGTSLVRHVERLVDRPVGAGADVLHVHEPAQRSPWERTAARWRLVPAADATC